MKKPGDGRYRYPFISCVNCGPRYSIMEAVPYDRDHITMREFAMCPSCRKEYVQMGNRRRHAQTISCHDCGPQLCWKAWGDEGAVVYREKEEALEEALSVLQRGGVIALKGIGGYQFSCRPDNADSVDRLRQLKHRDKKPFAVMFPSMESIREVCMVSERRKHCFFTGPADCASESEKRQVRLCIGSERRKPVPGSFSSLHGAASDAYRSRRASVDDQRQCDG